VTVIFSTVFKEETDRIVGKVFLQVSIMATWVNRGSAFTRSCVIWNV
jgi:hypothetical protein